MFHKATEQMPYDQSQRVATSEERFTLKWQWTGQVARRKNTKWSEAMQETYLFSGAVGAHSSFPVVGGAMERYRLPALALLVVHLVALLYLDAVHLDGASGLAGHYHL